LVLGVGPTPGSDNNGLEPGKQGKKAYIIACMPAHNEESTIAGVMVRAKRHVDRIVVCDDGSTDATAEIASALGAVVLRHERNIGYGAALKTLFDFAQGTPADIVVTLDADGQHDPNDIPAVADPIASGEADIAIGSRFLGLGEVPEHRKAGIAIINRVARSGSYNTITDTQSGFRAYNMAAIKAAAPTESGMGASTEILLKAKGGSLRVAEVPIAARYEKGARVDTRAVRQGGSVVFNTFKHLSIEKPHIFYGVPGAVALLVGLYFAVWTIQQYLELGYMAPTLLLIAIGGVLVGVMLLSMMITLWVLVSVVREARR
jgi:glycosyltransferase involved in cell wall biosynthesis